MATNDVVVGVFDDRVHARAAVQELRDAGFTEAQIGIAARDEARAAGETHAAGVERGAGTAGESKAPEGAGAGAAAGAGVGALWALGISAGVLPAIGPVIAGGVLASLVASAAGGAVAGGIVGALVGLGIPEEDAQAYGREFEAGRTIVTVRDDLRHAEASSILDRHGARNIHHHSNA